MTLRSVLTLSSAYLGALGLVVLLLFTIAFVLAGRATVRVRAGTGR